jgi:hypothetical protein
MGIKVSLKKKGKPQVEDDLDPVEVEVEEEEEAPRRQLVKLGEKVKKRQPIATIMGADLDDEEVVEEMEAAVKRASSFGYKLDHIRSHLQNRDYQNASLTTKEALLATLIELVPLAESSLRKSGASKGIYQFNSLIGQVRELLVDLDGERDLNQMVLSILEGSIRPSFLMLTQMLIQFNNGLKRQFRAEFDDKQCKILHSLLDEQVRELSSYVQQMYGDVLKRVEMSLEK